jgi:ankyrin repeat protein
LITNLLAVLTAATERLEVFLIFDALDECAERDYLMDVLSNLESGSCGNIKILATSRRERDIELAILPLVQDHVSIQDEKIEGDIRLFVVNSIANGAKMRRWPTAVKTEVEYALVQGAKGMFRWVKCQFDVLRNCTTVRDVKKSLITLPPTLDETYERILLNIDRAEREKVRIALQWLIFSERPLRLEEISEGVVVDPGSVSFSTDDRMFEPHDIVSICRSLVSLSDRTSGLRLAHYSVQEYLLGERIREGPVSFFGVFEAPSQVLIAEVCLTYILLFDKPDSLSENSLSEWPLLDYACRHWFHHARKLGDIPDRYGATKLANKLFTPDGRFSFLNWLRVFEPDTPWIDFNPHKDPSPFATPLYYASFCGLLDIVKSLLANGADITARGGNYIKPLNAATTENSDTASRFLIENGAEVNIMDNTGRRPLHNACIHGNAELARILLESGADVEARDSAGGSSMHISCFEGDIRIVRVLVEYDAEIDGRAHFTRDNLEPGSSLEARWNIGRTPLMEAAWNGQEEMVQLLLEMGADINAVDDHGMTSLIRAARRGHEKVVQKLLSHGADTSVKDKKGRTYEDWLERK